VRLVEVEDEVVVAKPVELVFPFLADPRNRPRWQASLRSVEMLTDGEPRVGMCWRERPGGLVWFELCIIELEPNQLWTERIRGAGIEGQIAMRFAAEGGATRIRVAVSLDLPRPLRLGAPLVRTLLPLAARRDLAQVERLV
jgi:uncharacterized membrane protein